MSPWLDCKLLCSCSLGCPQACLLWTATLPWRIAAQRQAKLNEGVRRRGRHLEIEQNQDQQVTVSIIILTWNSEQQIGACLASLDRGLSEFPSEVIVD